MKYSAFQKFGVKAEIISSQEKDFQHPNKRICPQPLQTELALEYELTLEKVSMHFCFGKADRKIAIL